MIESSVIQKVGNNPRLIVIESYLSKSSKKNTVQNETIYLK